MSEQELGERFMEAVQPKEGMSAGAKIVEGLASITSGMVADLHAAYTGVFFGNGQVNPPPYLAGKTGDELQSGISDVFNGGIEAVFGKKEPSPEVQNPEITQSKGISM